MAEKCDYFLANFDKIAEKCNKIAAEYDKIATKCDKLFQISRRFDILDLKYGKEQQKQQFSSSLDPRFSRAKFFLC